ncbi:kelch-like protein 38 [Engraulis encrasicolus]|uniref:kelch-like protein 38 n=1 Tax=Engraulis encrasicolus TaxID=184585 RepID=UPI002FD0E5D3
MCPGKRMDPQPLADVLHFNDKELVSGGLLSQLDLLRREGLLTDVVLCAEGTELPCHRAVLASSSLYFHAMFCSSFQESCRPRVVLGGVSAEALAALVAYVYTGVVGITPELVLPLMQAASMLQYGRLFEACSAFLQTQLAADNCLGMMRLAESLSCGSLRRQACQVAARCFPALRASDDFSALSPSELADVLGDDRLCAGEEQAFEAMLAWIQHDLTGRRSALQELFRRLRFRHVHPTYLFQFVASEPLVRASPACAELIETARRLLFSMDAMATPCPGSEIEEAWVAPRREACHEALVLVGGRKDSRQTSREALLYDPSSEQWRRLAKVPVRLYGASCACVQGLLYVLGGVAVSAAGQHATGAPTDTVYALSLTTNQWRAGEPMLAPRYAHQSVSSLHFLFVLGGVAADRQLSGAVERFNTMFSQWEAMAPMPCPVLHPAMAAHGQRIYVFGGEDSKQDPVRMIQVYHMVRNLWCKIDTRMVKNVCAPAAVIDNKIYIVGGYTRRTIAYDTKDNKFVKCASLKDRRMHHSATVIDNKLYVTGGRFINSQDTIEDSDAFDCYDPSSDQWSSKGKLPHRLFGHCSVPLVCISSQFLT